MGVQRKDQLSKIVQPEQIATDSYARVTIRVGDDCSDIERVACRIADLWSNEYVQDSRYNSYVIDVPENGRIEIAVPKLLIQTSLGVTQILNLLTLPTEYNFSDSITLEKLEFPPGILKRYKGPKYGVEGIRRAFAVESGPLVGAILKPRLAVNLQEIASVVGDIVNAGLDFLVDDELIVDPLCMTFEQRLSTVMDAMSRANHARQTRASFIANITASPMKTKKLARQARQYGASAVVTNALVMSFGAIEDLRNARDSLPIFSTNIGAAMLAKGANSGRSAGITESLLAKLTRMAGADAVHGGIEAVDWYASAPGSGAKSALGSKLGNVLPAFRVIAGGLNIVSLIENWPSENDPVIFEAGGAIFNHPTGVFDGAYALQKAREIATDYVSDDPESKSIALAALVQLSGKEKRVEHALSQVGWSPSDKVKELARQTLKPKKRKSFWG